MKVADAIVNVIAYVRGININVKNVVKKKKKFALANAPAHIYR